MEKIEGELNEVQQAEIHKQCKKMGMIPVSNLPNEDLRLAELNHFGILEKDLNQEKKQMQTYLICLEGLVEEKSQLYLKKR